MKVSIAVIAILAVASCAPQPATRAIEFLTRDGCANTGSMKGNLDEALRRMSRKASCDVTDLDRLPAGDARKAYPTPTVLYGGDDIFGLPQPTPPYPDPT